jgi:hypothetical protein
MKKNLIRRAVIAGALCTVLVLPSFAQGTDVRTVPHEDAEIMPISYQYKHWSETHIDQLSRNYDVEQVFADKDLNAAAALEDFQYLVKLIIDEGYNNAPDSMTREAVVFELANMWAEKTGQDLERIPVIKMLIYSDTDEIDAKYNYGVTVAYMKNIARGKGERIFDPKAYVTYGELAALINNTVKAIESESPSANKPITEGRFETKGSCKVENEKVLLNFELMSHYPEQRVLKFGSGQQFEVAITDEEGKEVYRYSDDKCFTMALIYKNIAPGESIKWQDEWDMTNKEGERLASGKYKAQIDILVIAEDSDEKVEKSQLSTVIDFNLGINDEKGENKADSQPKYELTEGGIIKPELAEEIIRETADACIHAISIKDSETISDYTHPVKGVRFTPYTNISLESDIVFKKEELKSFFEDQQVYLWGYYDGTGNEISLTPAEYYDRFIYSEDFIDAEEIGYNEVLSTGNMIENQFEVYDNAIVVEYYFPGFNAKYAGMDWKSLRLVFEQHEDVWKLVGIIHNQWTI